ncbi:MAG: DUF6364 family protein [Nitrospiraceae bacterium]|nr:DUF6364 family protein [Nitrospiraceae bacterium]
MQTKLTLRLNEDLIEKAKKTARIKGVSLSKMVADYFRSISANKSTDKTTSPVLSEISGILKAKAGLKQGSGNYKKHLEDKYL